MNIIIMVVGENRRKRLFLSEKERIFCMKKREFESRNI